jgi:UDP-N-acetylmuramoyl-tripeptide--D-alanyl-D-alanine ligase
MAMRGAGQIAELTRIAAPDVGVIVNVGPVHLELLGTIEAIAAAKGELIAEIASGATVVVPVNEPLLEPHRRADVRPITFGNGGDVSLRGSAHPGEVTIRHETRLIALRPSFAQAHNLSNLLAAVAAARALGVTPDGDLEVRFSALRGERIELPGEIVLVNDCYNANPMSMRAAIEDLTETRTVTPASTPAPGPARGRRVAVLGDMLELGDEGSRLHCEVGAYAAERGVDVLVTVGPHAAEIADAFAGEAHRVPDADAAAELLGVLLREGDMVLVKGSRGVGLERVAQVLEAEGEAHAGGPPHEQRAQAVDLGERWGERGSNHPAGRR